MSRINAEIDDDACAQVMRMYNLDTTREAINLALRKLAVVPMTKDEALAMRGFWKDRPLDDPIVPDDAAPHHLRTDAHR
jgi:Arc/MetJ family transcription regulator